MKIELEANFDEFTEYLRQLPFATALALTRTAQDVQAEIRRQLPQRFTLRNSWVEKGIRIERATKSKLEARVYSRDDFMRLQETGGTKTPRAGRSLAIPEDVRSSPTQVVRANRRPEALRGTRGVFRATIHGLDGLWQRTTTRKGTRTHGFTRERTLKLLFVFKGSVPVRPRFGFFDTGQKTAAERWGANFEAAWSQAVRTARR